MSDHPRAPLSRGFALGAARPIEAADSQKETTGQYVDDATVTAK